MPEYAELPRELLIKTMKTWLEDPMWADHVEFPKKILEVVIRHLETQATIQLGMTWVPGANGSQLLQMGGVTVGSVVSVRAFIEPGDKRKWAAGTLLPGYVVNPDLSRTEDMGSAQQKVVEWTQGWFARTLAARAG